MNARIFATSVILIFVATGCATPIMEQDRTGFISDYSKLERESKMAYRYTSDKLSEYEEFLIDDPVFLFQRAMDVEERKFTDEDLENLTDYFRARLTKVLTGDERYRIVTSPGAGVARLRVAITALDPSNGLLNVTIYTKVTGAGLGGAAMEGEIVDSITGEQLGAAIAWGSGSRVLRAGLTKLGDAKLQINRWAGNFRERIDGIRMPMDDE